MEYIIKQETPGEVILFCPSCGKEILEGRPKWLLDAREYTCRNCSTVVDLRQFFEQAQTIVCLSCGMVQSETRKQNAGIDRTACEFCPEKIALSPINASRAPGRRLPL
jgi:predicted RNA-binding Zn-ribbon protein involved in translation (DUF1610 family)